MTLQEGVVQEVRGMGASHVGCVEHSVHNAAEGI